MFATFVDKLILQQIIAHMHSSTHHTILYKGSAFQSDRHGTHLHPRSVNLYKLSNHDAHYDTTDYNQQ